LVLALRRIRCFLLGAAIAVAAMGAASPNAVAQGAPATVKGAEERNFGRILLTLPKSQKVTARVANGVLVVSFTDPVAVSAERIVREMPSYVSVARVDPDGRGLRLALVGTFEPNVMEAGERVFIDLIPANWQGVLPGLPQEVVNEMAERLRRAETIARDLVRTREPTQARQIEVRAASLPTLSRLIFDVPPTINVDAEVEGRKVDIAIRGPVTLEAARLRALLPKGLALESSEAVNGALRIALRFDDGLQVKTFREEDGFVLDLINPQRAAGSPEAAAQVAAQPPARAQAPTPATPPAPEPPRAAPPQAPQPAPAVAAAVPAAAPAAPAPAPPQAVAISSSVGEEGGRIDFQFPRRTAAAAYDQNGETVIVFDTIDQIDPSQLLSKAGALLESATAVKEGKATVLRLKARKAGLVRLAPDGLRWSLTIGDKGVTASEALLARRGIDEHGQSVVQLPLARISGVHWIEQDASVGGQGIAVATAYGPGASTPKPQRFVEFQVEATTQGVVVRPFADDLKVRAGFGEVIIGKAGGVTVSAAAEAPAPGRADPQELVADRASWNEMRLGVTRDRLQELTMRSAEAPRSERSAARLRLATFQLANGLDSEALGPLGAVLSDDPNMRNDRRLHLMRALAQIMLLRKADAEKTLSVPFLKDDAEAALWLAVTEARQGRFTRALAAFRRSAEIVDAYPELLQTIIRREIIHSAIAMRDHGVAERELQILGAMAPTWLPRDEIELLRAQIDEIAGRPEAALAGYKSLFDSELRPVAARAQLKGVQLADREGDKSTPPEEALARLETVSFVWRGDDVEIEAIGELGSIYAKQRRWREAFALARKANGFFPDHPITRKLHDETAQQFEELFTSGKADQLPRIDALALFYDFKEFMPIGRRGDEIIRRLADRLVEVDLLDQAAELLQHQIDNRLTGAARATVATRLAMIRLMNNKPAEALRALSTTRLPELPAEVKRARLLLEAKGLSDLSRTDLALEVLGAERGPEVERLRADILWTARRWREAGEAHERILGDAWRGAELDPRHRADAMRAAVAYVMADEALSLDRLRAKYAAPMSQTPDARTFAFVTGASRASGGDLRELARTVASADTLMEFMSEYRKRYPDLASSLRQRQNGPQPADGAPGTADGATPATVAPGAAPASPAPARQADAAQGAGRQS
jgi:tetratricopeptide (TPR) repeat protein